MAFIDRLWAPIRHLARTLFRRDQVEHELSQELDGYLDMLVEEKRRAGLSPQEARRAARLEFGGLDAVKDDCRQAWGLRFLEEPLLGRLVAGQIRRQQLDGHLALQARVEGGVDDPHAAVAEFGADGVRAEGGAWAEGHGARLDYSASRAAAYA